MGNDNDNTSFLVWTFKSAAGLFIGFICLLLFFGLILIIFFAILSILSSSLLGYELDIESLTISLNGLLNFAISSLPVVAALALIVAIWAQIGSSHMPRVSLVKNEFYPLYPDKIPYVIKNFSDWPARNISIIFKTGAKIQKETISFLDAEDIVELEFKVNASPRQPNMNKREDMIIIEYEPLNHPELRVKKEYMTEVEFLYKNNPESYYRITYHAIDKNTGKKYKLAYPKFEHVGV